MRRTLPALMLSAGLVLSACGAEDAPGDGPAKPPPSAKAEHSKDLVLGEIQDACSAVSPEVLERAGFRAADLKDDCRWTHVADGQVTSLSTSIGAAPQSFPGHSGAELASSVLADQRASGATKIDVPGAPEAVSDVDVIAGMQSLSLTARYRNALVLTHLVPPKGTTPAAAKSLAPVLVAATADVIAELGRRAADDGAAPADEPTQLVPDAAPDACSAVTVEHLAALGLEKPKAGACDWSHGEPGTLRTLHAFDLDGLSAGSAERSYERALGREHGSRAVTVSGAERAVLVDQSDERRIELKLLLLGRSGFARLTYRAPAPADRAALEKALLAAAGDVAAALDDVM